MKKIIMILFSLLLIVGCEKDGEQALNYKNDNNKEVTYEVKHGDKTPVAVIELEDGDEIAIELYPEYAPNTVNNFIYLANEKEFYDGLVFHRVIQDFMIQAGCPYGTGVGGPGYSIFGEFTGNNFSKNTLSNKKGTIAMARSSEKNSAGSQFYINVNDNDFLDGEYAVFGLVIQGYDKAVEISNITDKSDSDKPNKDVVIKSIRVELNGYNYEEPEKLDEQ